MLFQQGVIASFRVKGPGEEISEPRRSWSPNPGVGDLAIANKWHQIRMGEKREPAHPTPPPCPHRLPSDFLLEQKHLERDLGCWVHGLAWKVATEGNGDPGSGDSKQRPVGPCMVT